MTAATVDRNAIRRSFAGPKARDRARDEAYRAGRAGQDIPFTGEDAELLDLYETGQRELEEERAAKKRAVPSSGRPAARGATKAPASAARRYPALHRTVRREAAPLRAAGFSVVHYFGLGLALAGLYLLLTNATALKGLVMGISTAFSWVTNPIPLPTA
jgi:hypothetical protein